MRSFVACGLGLALGLAACGGATRPTATRPTATRPTATRPTGTRPAGARPAGARPTGASQASAVARAQRTHEYPASAPPAQQTVGGASSAGAAVEAFATAYINWTAATVSHDMLTLATHSVGQARAAMQLAAAQTASDYELRRGGIANRGVVEAVAPVRNGGGRYVVVTRELTTATSTTAYQGLLPAWHVTLATVSRQISGRWVVSGWQAES